MVGFQSAKRDRGGRALGRGAHTVIPAIAGDEIAAGVADGARAKLPDQFDHLLTEAVLVGSGRAGFINSVIDAPAQVLNERTEDPPVQGCHNGRWVNPDNGGAMTAIGL